MFKRILLITVMPIFLIGSLQMNAMLQPACQSSAISNAVGALCAQAKRNKSPIFLASTAVASFALGAWCAYKYAQKSEEANTYANEIVFPASAINKIVIFNAARDQYNRLGIAEIKETDRDDICVRIKKIISQTGASHLNLEAKVEVGKGVISIHATSHAYGNFSVPGTIDCTIEVPRGKHIQYIITD